MDNKIRLLLLMPELYHGGAEKQVRNIISNIDKDRFELFVAVEHSFRSRISERENGFIAKQRDVTFKALPGLNVRGSALMRHCSALIINAELVPLLISYRPDILITYDLLGLKTTVLAKLLGAKCIFCERNSGEYPQRFFRSHRVFLKSIAGLIANSRTGQKNWRQHGIQADYIPNGIEVTEKRPADRQREFTIVVPARIAPVKNQEILIRAIVKIEERINVLFIGKTEDNGYKATLEKLATDLNVGNRIRFQEYMDDITSIYSQASLIVLPSVSEGFANVVLESYMFGRLCLLSDISMNRDIGAPGQRYFHIDDAEELAKQIMTVMRMEPKEMNLEIDRNYAYVVSHYSMENMMRQYEEKLKALCRPRSEQT